jgi:hypothetical protein
VTLPRTRLLASAATAIGLLAGGFEAHLAPQVEGYWHGLTGSLSPILLAAASLSAIAVWRLGRVVSVRPFWWMSTGLLPFIPGMAGVGAPLLFFSNYTMVLVFAILLGSSARDLLPRGPGLEPFSVFLISFSFFVFVGRFLPGPAGPQGDEPHYLLIAESLIRDGDVDLKNQFEERAFSKFTSARLEPHTAARSPKDKLYAVHTPGLAALIAPGYTVLGYAGARAIVSLVVALAIGLLFFTTRALFGAAAANFVFLLAAFASPLPIYANSVFPDSVAVLPVAAALACLVSTRPALMALASASIACLPWLHPRFLPLAVVLALAVTFRGGFSRLRAAVSFGPLLLSLSLLLAHFQSLFGSAALSAAYGPGFSSDVSLSRIPFGASALILDRQFGLLLLSPALLLGVGGGVALWKRDRFVAGLSIAVTALVLGVGGSFTMWWGGASPPARFLIGVLPVLLLLCGGMWQAAPERRPGLGAAFGFGLGLLFLACLAPRVLHNRADGDSGLLRLLAPVLDVDRFFPGLVRPEQGLALAWIWGLALLAALVKPRLGWWFAALPLAFGVVTSPRPLLDPFSSSLRTLEGWDDHRRCFGGVDARSAFSLDIPLGAAAWDLGPGLERFSPRFSLPPGRWTVRVESSAELTPGALNVARVSLVGDDEGGSALVSVPVRAGENEATVDFDLARGERRVRLRGEGLQSAARVLRVSLAGRAPGVEARK